MGSSIVKFDKKNYVDRDSNPGFLREKLVPYHLSHNGVDNQTKCIMTKQTHRSIVAKEYFMIHL